MTEFIAAAAILTAVFWWVGIVQWLWLLHRIETPTPPPKPDVYAALYLNGDPGPLTTEKVLR